MNENQKIRRTHYCRTRYPFILLAVMLALLVGFSTIQAQTRKIQTGRIEQTTGIDETKRNSEPGEKLTVWRIIQWNDFLLWPFVVLTAVGLMLVIYQGLLEYREKNRSQSLLQTKFRANQIRAVVQMVRTSKPNRAKRLLYQILSTFDKTKQAEPIGNDINQFLAGERNAFETINRIVGFLSETAGALGLLGTVWGIFITFHSGKLDGAIILQGMSVALVTTITGLIISLVLNTGSIYAFTLFNRQLTQLADKAEELRQVLLYLEKKSANDLPEEKEPVKNVSPVKPIYQAEKHARIKTPLEIAFAEI